MFDRTKPCKTCIFRTNKNALRGLGRERAQEIAQSLLGDKAFTCHDDLPLPEVHRNHCVGAMAMLENLKKPNQAMRIAQRLRLIGLHDIEGHGEVFKDFDDFIAAQSSDTSENSAHGRYSPEDDCHPRFGL